MGDFRLYQDVQEYSKRLLKEARFDSLEDLVRDTMVVRMSKEILTEVVDEETYVIPEEPVWTSARAHYVAELPDGYRKRFLKHFWDLSDDDLKPKIRKHIVTLKRWTEHPFDGIPKQSIEETMGYWA